MGWYVAFLMICGANGVVCTLNDFHPGTWQFWFYCLAVVCAYNFGRAYGG